MSDDNEKQGWHVGKEIPIAILAALFLQSGGVIWWAATLNARIERLSQQVSDMSANAFTIKASIGMGELYRQRDMEQDRRLRTLEERVHDMEAKHK